MRRWFRWRSRSAQGPVSKMPSAKPKVSAALRVTYNPAASCRVQGCTWEYPSSQATRKLAKRHALNTGHEVEVLVEDLTIYRREG